MADRFKQLTETAFERLDNALGSLPGPWQVVAFLAIVAAPATVCGVVVGALTHWALGILVFCVVLMFSARWLSGRLDRYSDADDGS